jgi:hypothetical protein
MSAAVGTLPPLVDLAWILATTDRFDLRAPDERKRAIKRQQRNRQTQFRIEAVVLAPDTHSIPQGGDIPASAAPEVGAAGLVRAQIDDAIIAANKRLAVSQRVAGWRLWPDADFPRTHTLKVKRPQVRAWVAVEASLLKDPNPAVRAITSRAAIRNGAWSSTTSTECELVTSSASHRP